jgi:hypothetical protein
VHVYVRLGIHIHTYALRKWINRRVNVDAPAAAYARRRAQALALICAYVQRTHYACWSCESAFIASSVACVPRRKCQAVATNPRARACSPIAVWTRNHVISACIRSNCTCMHMLAVCAHTVVGSCCGLGCAVYTLSSGSSLPVIAQSIYNHTRVFIDRRLRTDHPCGMPYVRAHVRGHERPCVRARARADLAMWVYIGSYLYIAIDGSDIYR